MFHYVVLRAEEHEKTVHDVWGSKRYRVCRVRGEFASVPKIEKKEDI